MKFLRGKTLRDPIYLKKNNDDYWMQGDIYDAACSCLDVVFRGRKNYFIESFSTKIVDFMSNLEYYKCSLTDKDGDSHVFVFRVVDKVPGQPEPKEPEKKAVETVKVEQPESTPELKQEEPPPPPPPPPPEKEEPPKQEEEDNTQEILEEAKREVEVEEMTAELIRENLLTTDSESDKVQSTKQRKKPRRKKAKKNVDE